MDTFIIGTEAKFALSIEALGFSMETNVFSCKIMKGRNAVKEYSKSDLVVDGDTFLICIDTNDIGVGSFDLAVTAEVPDEHFQDGYRTEIARVPLLNVKKL